MYKNFKYKYNIIIKNKDIISLFSVKNTLTLTGVVNFIGINTRHKGRKKKLITIKRKILL